MSPQYKTVGGYINTDPYYVSPENEADIKEARMNIKTEHIYPPISHRGNDWCAWIDGSDEETRLCGWGATEEAAIADLKMLLEDGEEWLANEMKSQELWD